MEKIKEMKRFAITSIVFGFLCTALTILMVYSGKGDESSIIAIGGGILFAIGFTLLPKALKLEKLHKDQEDV